MAASWSVQTLARLGAAQGSAAAAVVVVTVTLVMLFPARQDRPAQAELREEAAASATEPAAAVVVVGPLVTAPTAERAQTASSE